MNTTQGFLDSEVLPFFGMLTTVLIVLIGGYMKGYKECWSPLAVIAIIFGYYCCLGPYEAILSGETYDRLINMRKYYPSAFWGAWISFLSIIAGFFLNTGRPRPEGIQMPNDGLLFKYGIRTIVVALILFSVSSGGNVLGLINPLDADSFQQTGGSFSNYFLLCVNFLIAGISLLFVYWLRTKKGLLWLLILVPIVVGLFITLGFRYRVVLLLGSMAITYYLTLQKKPNLITAPILIVALIAFMGLINIARIYGSGLNTGKLEGVDTESYYRSGLKESLIFQTSGAVIDYVPRNHDFAGFTPIMSTILFPIPQQFYPSKNSAGYMVDMLKAIYGNTHYKGSAYMAYAEHYLSFGWLGICLWGLVIGWMYKKLWLWYAGNKTNPWVIVAYGITVSYLYVILSRGYLPQVTMLFFFSVFPIYFLYRQAKRNSFVRMPAHKPVINPAPTHEA